MTGTWLIVNSRSGSYDPAEVAALETAFGESGRPVARLFTIPADHIPTAQEAMAAAPALIAIYTGDGTVSAAVDALEGWDGPMLVLPGGTMNLLARKLHGDADALEIIKNLGREPETVRLTQAEGCGQRSLVGIIAGPTTAWGNVREDLRKADMASLAKSVPDALTQTLKGDLVSIADAEGDYQAIFIEPQPDALSAVGIRAANITDLVQHGFAWLTRDFLGGPTEPLAHERSVTITGGGDSIGLLVDGERAKGHTPCTFTLRQCPLSFVTTVEDS